MVGEAKRAITSKSGITITSAIATIIMLAGVYQAAPALGFNIPRWAWHAELRAVEREMAELYRPVADERIEDIEQELTTLELAIQQLNAQRDEVPGWMIRDAVELELQLKRWRAVEQRVNDITRPNRSR